MVRAERILKPALAKCGGAIIAISHQETGLAEFQQKYFSGETYLDDAKSFYRALGGHEGNLAMLSMDEVKVRGRAAYKMLKADNPLYKISTDGDGISLGGSLLFDATGRVRFMHAERSFGDVAAPEALLAALNRVQHETKKVSRL